MHTLLAFHRRIVLDNCVSPQDEAPNAHINRRAEILEVKGRADGASGSMCCWAARRTVPRTYTFQIPHEPDGQLRR